ncbi:helix-turn-helix transcriptional regulator [Granulicoccus sp. GXG6511]|uniref:helix-turn-helix transcriptional regulator n=1 Tax=Granulicoccus sp. GXG6511 TaxID=3381351 RepID=UPI003D7CA31A
MAETTRRVLTLLSLLESRPTWSGPDLAERLGVTTRTIRRDVERLRELGYPVHGEQGSEGGYRLGRGRRLPPLVLDDEEAVAVALCLRQGAGGGVAGIEEQALRALTKLDQVLPARLSAEVHAIDDATAALPPAGGPRADVGLLTRLAHATKETVRVRFDYTARDGAVTSRHVEPYRLVTTGRLWYLFCFDLDRDDWRTFRIDRIGDLHVTTFRFQPQPSPDPVEHVRRAFPRAPWPHVTTVRFGAPLAKVRARIPEQYATCTADGDDATIAVCGSDNIDDLARHLALAAFDLGAELTVIDPPEFAARMRTLAGLLVG